MVQQYHLKKDSYSFGPCAQMKKITYETTTQICKYECPMNAVPKQLGIKLPYTGWRSTKQLIGGVSNYSFIIGVLLKDNKIL